MKKMLLLTGLAALMGLSAISQSVGVGTNTPNPNAALDVSATDKGMLVPRVTATQRAAIPHTQGLLVYDITDNSFWHSNGTIWQKISTGAGGGASLPAGQNNGDLLYWNGTAWAVLPVGQNGQTLRICNGSLTWSPVCLPPGLMLETSPFEYDFNSLDPLPGWLSVNTGATSTSVGAAAAYTSDLKYHWATSSAGARSYASATGYALPDLPDSATQSLAANRALGFRQVAASDAGVAFTMLLENTIGKTGLNMSFKLQSLDTSSPRIATWTVEYGIGDAPAAFVNASPTGTLTTGGKAFSNNTINVNFGSALDNKATKVWIRIATLGSTSGSGNRPTTAIDDLEISWN